MTTVVSLKFCYIPFHWVLDPTSHFTEFWTHFLHFWPSNSSVLQVMNSWRLFQCWTMLNKFLFVYLQAVFIGHKFEEEKKQPNMLRDFKKNNIVYGNVFNVSILLQNINFFLVFTAPFTLRDFNLKPLSLCWKQKCIPLSMVKVGWGRGPKFDIYKPNIYL